MLERLIVHSMSYAMEETELAAMRLFYGKLAARRLRQTGKLEGPTPGPLSQDNIPITEGGQIQKENHDGSK
jgi:hypothetical protein